jgi:hypothetical protein
MGTYVGGAYLTMSLYSMYFFFFKTHILEILAIETHPRVFFMPYAKSGLKTYTQHFFEILSSITKKGEIESI